MNVEGVKRGFRRGSIAMPFALVGAAIGAGIGALTGVNPLHNGLFVYSVVFVLAYFAAVLVDRDASQSGATNEGPSAGSDNQ